jgi:hypothetical protein
MDSVAFQRKVTKKALFNSKVINLVIIPKKKEIDALIETHLATKKNAETESAICSYHLFFGTPRVLVI